MNYKHIVAALLTGLVLNACNPNESKTSTAPVPTSQKITVSLSQLTTKKIWYATWNLLMTQYSRHNT